MTRSAVDALEIHYKSLQEDFPVKEEGGFADLVVPTGNSAQPVHRWFHLKEAFSHKLLGRILADCDIDGRDRALRVVDPFTGSGTTAVSTGTLPHNRFPDRRFLGVEVNPFLHLLSSTKVRSLQQPPGDLLVAAGKVARDALRHGGDHADELPGLSTFADERYFPRVRLGQLLALRSAIESISRSGVDALTFDQLRVALATIIEPSSQLRRDGRTLRYAADKESPDPIELFLRVVEGMSDDLPRRPLLFDGRVERADSRESGVMKSACDANLVLFSPPYPNNIDYTEVYKLEAWLLRLITQQDEFQEQRRRTVRSHGSLQWDETYRFEGDPRRQQVEELLDPIVNAIPTKDRYSFSRRQVVLGFADDMLSVFDELARVVENDGHVVFVVGNSLHGRAPDDYVIASDIVMGHLAMLAGFHVERIEVARYPRRRRSRSAFLRESVVFARRSS